MRRRTFEITFKTWDESGETTETAHKEFNVSDSDLARVEAEVAGIFQTRVEVGQKKLNPA